LFTLYIKALKIKKEITSKLKYANICLFCCTFASKKIIMKKICFICLMVLVPFMGYSTSVTMVRQKWAEKHRSISRCNLSLYEKDGDVVLSSDEVLHSVDVMISTRDNSTLKVVTSVTVNSEIKLLVEDEIHQEGCCVKISQGEKYVLYFVTRD
jgi:hypothetical protein